MSSADNRRTLFFSFRPWRLVRIQEIKILGKGLFVCLFFLFHSMTRHLLDMALLQEVLFLLKTEGFFLSSNKVVVS